MGKLIDIDLFKNINKQNNLKGQGGGTWRDASSSESEGERDEHGNKINKGSTLGAALKGALVGAIGGVR